MYEDDGSLSRPPMNLAHLIEIQADGRYSHRTQRDEVSRRTRLGRRYRVPWNPDNESGDSDE